MKYIKKSFPSFRHHANKSNVKNRYAKIRNILFMIFSMQNNKLAINAKQLTS